jgi:hypothetical protein
MKKLALATMVLFVGLAVVSTLVLAQANPRGEANFADGKVTIDYGRPSAKGRDVMSMISPGSYWRMGADSATTLKTEVDLVFGDTTVPKGSYTLVAHFVEKEKWNLVIAKSMSSGQPEEVAAEVPGKLVKGEDNVEQLTIDLKGEGEKGTFVLSWTSYRLAVDFKVGS